MDKKSKSFNIFHQPQINGLSIQDATVLVEVYV